MSAPAWCRALLRALAPADRCEDMVGDLEEAHGDRLRVRGRVVATLLTAVETLDVSWALLRARIDVPVASMLDFRLGVRMLVKYPGLTVIGGVAMAFAIWVGAITFEAVDQIVDPSLPLEDGGRIVGVQLRNLETGRPMMPTLADFERWQAGVRSIVELGAFRSESRNLIQDGGAAEPVLVAQITAVGMGVARVNALLGRTIDGADEAPGAPAVLVIGHDIWQSSFAGDPGVVGRVVRLGARQHTVIGVMPEAFGFPLMHGVWVPFRSDVAGAAQDARVVVLGRLAAGSTLKSAQAELTLLSERQAAEEPDLHGHVRASVLPYARSVQPLPDIGPIGLLAANVFGVLLLVLICGNVALLTFARAVSREAEMAVRSALGASRGRIVAQLFAEALVLGGIAAVIGLVGAALGMRWYATMLEVDSGGQVPFWVQGRLAPTTVVYLVLLTLLAAAVTGAGPALKATRQGVGTRLRRASAGMAPGRLGGIWTVVIASQVAITVFFPAIALFLQRHTAVMQSLDMGFAAEQYLSVRLEMDGESGLAGAAGPQGSTDVRLTSAYRRLEERLSADSQVAAVTFASRLPGMYHPVSWFEIEGADAADAALHAASWASVVHVAVNYLQAIDAPILAGRTLTAGDTASLRHAVVVNRAFVDKLLDGRNAIGRRVRYARAASAEPGPWYEIVGVTANLGVIAGNDMDPRDDPAMYVPSSLARLAPVHMAVRVRGDADAFVPRLRAAAGVVEPGLELHDPRRLDRVAASLWTELQFLYRVVTAISLVALILSLTAIYSVTAFAVSRRTREIGVRVALGSDRRRIVATIFRRPLMQVVSGIAIGAVLVALAARGLTGPLSGRELGLLALYAAFMLGVCLLACVVPTRRVLGVEPAVALRADG